MKTKNLFMNVLVILSFNVAYGETVMSPKAFLKKNLSTYKKMTREKFDISGEALSGLKQVAVNAADKQAIFYYGKSEDGQMQLACTTVPQKGKDGPMSLGVCFEPSGLVSAIEILEFNEDRGQKARERGFLDQFKGKSLASGKLYVGQDIHGVSGATYTSEYISEAVRKAAFLFNTYVEKK